MCKAKIIGRRQVPSDMYPGQRRVAYKVEYAIDKFIQEFEEEELRPLLLVSHLAERKAVINSLVPAFEYLEARLSGACQFGYCCKDMYNVSCQPLRSIVDLMSKLKLMRVSLYVYHRCAELLGHSTQCTRLNTSSHKWWTRCSPALLA